jgi:hypothetical protein
LAPDDDDEVVVFDIVGFVEFVDVVVDVEG